MYWSRNTDLGAPDLHVCPTLLGRWHQCPCQAQKSSSPCWSNEGFVFMSDAKAQMGEGLRAGKAEMKEAGFLSLKERK